MLFYSYLWLREEDESPYYAGKGSGNRAFISHGHSVHRPSDDSRILVFWHTTETEAFESEMAFIKWFGRKDNGTGCLQNHTDGGENPPNWKGKKRGAAFAKQVSERRRGVPSSEETKEKIRASRLGTHWTQAARDKMSKTRTGVPYSASHKAAAKLAHQTSCRCFEHVRTRNLAREVQENELRG
jgi:hypothetical protein